MIDGTQLTEQAIHQKVQRDLENYGWSVVTTVFGQTLLAQTIGLEENFGHPDIEICGLPEELGTLFLNTIAQWIKDGSSFEIGSVITELVEDYEFLFVMNPLNPDGPPVTENRLRLIWPDSNALYPWDVGCEEGCAVQCLLPDADIPQNALYV